MAQLRLDGLVRSGQQFSACNRARKTAVEPCTDEVGCRQARQQGKAGVDGDDRLSVANQKPLDGGIREIAHPVDFEFGTSAVPDIEHDTRQRQADDGEARDRHAHRQPSGGQRRLRNLDGGIGNDRHRAHRREVMAADRQRQQQRAADLPFLFLAMQADRKCDGADCGAEHDRCGDKNGIPQDRAGDFKCRHPGVVHRCDAAGDDGAADPRPVAPVRGQRHAKPHGGQRYRRDQRHDGQDDIVAARDPRRECEHRDEVRRPDAEAGGNGRYRQPHVPHLAAGFPGVAKQIDRGK